MSTSTRKLFTIVNKFLKNIFSDENFAIFWVEWYELENQGYDWHKPWTQCVQLTYNRAIYKHRSIVIC